jgi:DNA-binding LacI/PurR family transcriptional regulator
MNVGPFSLKSAPGVPLIHSGRLEMPWAIFGSGLNGRRLVLRRAQSIAVIQGSNIGTVFGDAFFRVVLEGIADVARGRGYSLLLAPATQDGDADFAVGFLGNGAIDGVLVLGAFDMALLFALRDRGLPFVLVDTYMPGVAAPAIYPDHRTGALLGTRHLLDHGHRQVAFLGGAVSYPFGSDTLEGYRAAVGARGMASNPAFIRCTEISIDAAMRAARSLLELSPAPTALFAATDAMAFGALRAAREAGVDVPARLAVVGMDDIELSAYTDPPLTTVRIPKGEMGALAARRLVARSKGNRTRRTSTRSPEVSSCAPRVVAH